MYLSVKNDNNFEVPQLEGVPTKFSQPGMLEESLPDLGFSQYNGFWEKQFLSESFQLNVRIRNIGYLYAIMFDSRGANKRTMVEPDEFGLLLDITAVEVLYLIFKWCHKSLPSNGFDDLQIGRLYSDQLKSIQRSIPCPPSIIVERDILRFYINKLKKEISSKNEGIIYVTIEREVLNIRFNNKLFHLNVICSNGMDSFTIEIPTSEILQHFPKRLEGASTALTLTSEGLMGMKAKWNGPSLHELELPRKYYEYLQNRITRRAIPY